MVVFNNKTITSTEVDKINYGQSFNVLERANAGRYTQLISPEDLIKIKLSEGVRAVFKNSSDKELRKFVTMLSNVYQSVTTKGLTTPEIVAYILNFFDKIDLNEKQKKELILQFRRRIVIFQIDFIGEMQGNNELHKEVLSNFTYSNNSDISQMFGDFKSYNKISSKFKNNFNDVGLRRLFNISSYLNFSDVKDVKNLEDFGKSVNSQIANPTKSNPNVSVIMLNDKNMRTGVKNSLELSTFFNLIPSLEYAKAYPFFNATFILPSVSKQDANSVFKTATLNQFLFGGTSQEKSDNFNNFEGKVIKDDKNVGVKTNLSVFTTPQTFVNMDENVGHRDGLSEDQKRLRITSIHDPTQPFMTLKDFTIDVSPTKGLMSFKTGKISLVLHDRTRMVDIAPFIKPDLFGAFGAEIVVEYGWSHNESQSKKDSGFKNPIGEFLHSSRCVEKYMIVNSQFSIENNGQVNINLSIAMKGPIDVRQTEIFADAVKQIEQSEISIAIASYQYEVSEATGRSSGTQDFTNISSLFSNLYANKQLPEESTKSISKTLKKIESAIKTFDKLREPGSARTRSLDNNFLTYFYLNQNLTAKEIVDFNEVFGFQNKLGLQKNGDSLSSHLPYVIVMFNTKLNDKTKEKVNLVGNIYDAIVNIKTTISDYLNKNTELKLKKRNFIKSLIGGTQFHDMFFDQRLIEVINNAKLDVAQRSEGLDDFQVEEINKESFISLGTVITSLVSTHMARSRKYDEIQIVFNGVNDKAGLSSAFRRAGVDRGAVDTSDDMTLNIASLLIKRGDLEKFLKKLFDEKISLTLESLISQIITNFIITRDNPCYGLSNLFTREDFDFPVKPKSKSSTKSAAKRLNYIYYGNSTELYDVDPSFLPPSIHMTFDSLTSLEDMSKTICRITVYDRNDNPYQSICDIYNERFLSRSKDFRKLKQIEKQLTSQTALIRKSKTKRNKIVKANVRIKELQSAADKLIKRLVDPNEGMFTIGSNGKYEFKSGFGFDDLKEKYKKIVPAATFATQNTSLINASVATVNEGKLNTVYITRADRNNKYELNNKVILDSPLRILPAQASIEMFGCPWINFGQYIFLDFETGTTLDNTYAVTGVKHTITPGKFSTQVSLSYGDAYGRYEGMADGFSQSLKRFIDPNEGDSNQVVEKPKVASTVLSPNKSIKTRKQKSFKRFSIKSVFFNDADFVAEDVLIFLMQNDILIEGKEVISYENAERDKISLFYLLNKFSTKNSDINKEFGRDMFESVIKEIKDHLRAVYEESMFLDVIYKKTRNNHGYKLVETGRRNYRYVKAICHVTVETVSTFSLNLENSLYGNVKDSELIVKFSGNPAKYIREITGRDYKEIIKTGSNIDKQKLNITIDSKTNSIDVSLVKQKSVN